MPRRDYPPTVHSSQIAHNIVGYSRNTNFAPIYGNYTQYSSSPAAHTHYPAHPRGHDGRNTSYSGNVNFGANHGIIVQNDLNSQYPSQWQGGPGWDGHSTVSPGPHQWDVSPAPYYPESSASFPDTPPSHPAPPESSAQDRPTRTPSTKRTDQSKHQRRRRRSSPPTVDPYQAPDQGQPPEYTEADVKPTSPESHTEVEAGPIARNGAQRGESRGKGPLSSMWRKLAGKVGQGGS